MHNKFSQRIETALEWLAGPMARSKRRLNLASVNQQIGRILERNQRATAPLRVKLEPDACAAGFRLTWPKRLVR